MHCYLPNDCLDSGIVFASWWFNSHQPAQILKFPQYLTLSNFPFSRYPFHCYPSIQLWGPSTKTKMNARRSSALLLIRLSISIKHEAPSPHVGQHHSSDMWQRTSKSTIHIYMSIKQLLIIMQCESTVITYNMSRVRDVLRKSNMRITGYESVGNHCPSWSFSSIPFEFCMPMTFASHLPNLLCIHHHLVPHINAGQKRIIVFHHVSALCLH